MTAVSKLKSSKLAKVSGARFVSNSPKKPSLPAPAKSSVKTQSVKTVSFVKLAQSDLDAKLEKIAELAVSELVKQGWKQQP